MTLRNYKAGKITEVADILGRPKKGTIYPEGCIGIQVSASKGETIYLDYDQEVDSKYVVVKPRGIIPYYLYLIVQRSMPVFLHRYRQGLNISAHDIRHMDITYHLDNETQADIALLMRAMEGEKGGEASNGKRKI